MRKVLLLILSLVLTLTLCGCGLFGKEEPAEDTGPSGTSLTIGVDEGSLSFDLAPPTDPGFTDGVDLSNIPDYSSQLLGNDDPEPMYMNKDGYAYLLDPATLQPVGPALDPDTHQPIEGTDVQYDAPGEMEPEVEPATVGDHASAVTPTPDNKYPNTGIFMEDD